jgi:hypothetical protein
MQLRLKEKEWQLKKFITNFFFFKPLLLFSLVLLNFHFIDQIHKIVFICFLNHSNHHSVPKILFLRFLVARRNAKTEFSEYTILRLILWKFWCHFFIIWLIFKYLSNISRFIYGHILIPAQQTVLSFQFIRLFSI